MNKLYEICIVSRCYYRTYSTLVTLVKRKKHYFGKIQQITHSNKKTISIDGIYYEKNKEIGYAYKYYILSGLSYNIMRKNTIRRINKILEYTF